MKVRSVHNRLVIVQDDVIHALNVDQCLEITNHALIKVAGKPICILFEGVD